ncbi:hypothetical protein BH11CYA1_BH11CYA1_22330 [soil metagenome]
MKFAYRLLICLIFVSTMINSAVAKNPISVVNKSIEPAPVVLDGAELFVIKTKLGPNDPAARAANILRKIERLSVDPDFKPDSIAVIDDNGETDIIAGDIVVTSITDIDAQAAGMPRSELADNYVDKLRDALIKHKAKRSIQGALEDASVENFAGTALQILFEPLTLKIIMALGGLAILSVIVAFVRRSLGRYIQESSKRYASKKIVDFCGYFFGLLLVTIVFKDALGNLAVVLGAATAGIAFALKEVIVSIAGWVAVTFGDFYKVGDRIQLGGIKGDVIDIAFGRTTLMELGEWVAGDLYTGRIVRVSNSFVFSEPFFNYSGDFPFLWDECKIPIKYGCDHKLTRHILEQAAVEVSSDVIELAEQSWRTIEKKYLVEDARTSPMVTLVLNDNWMEFTVRYVVNYRRRRLAKDQLFTLILEAVEKTEGKVAFASATFQLVEAPPLDIRVVASTEQK